MKKLLLYFMVYTLIIALPFVTFITVGECVPNRYDNVFTASLVDKYDRLVGSDEQKIVFVGGSSLPFGLRCDLVEQQLNLTAVDLGVYASLGTVAMMEISLANLNHGDIVVLAPELAQQTYSMYFNADTMWQAVNQNRRIIRWLSWDEKQQMAYHYMRFLYQKIGVSRTQGVSADELYSRTSFNAYGDIVYPRPYNLMPDGYDKSQLIDLPTDVASFAAYVNRYIDILRQKGVDVYYAFSPTNAAAVAYTEQEANQFVWQWQDSVHCTLLGTIQDFTYDARYFYNTNYHLNDAGAVLHTVNLINALKRQLNMQTPTDIPIPEVETPASDPASQQEDPNARYFEVQSVGGNWFVTGVKEAYRNSTELTLPTTVDGHVMAGLNTECFAGCAALERLTIPDNYRMFEMGIFLGCGNLKRIDLLLEKPGATSIPIEGLFDGANPQLKVYVKRERYSAFISNYTWSRYASYISRME